MKKFLLFVLVVLLGTVVMMLANDALNRYLVFATPNANPYKMYRLFHNDDGGEIPIIGSSRAEAGFAPKEISDYAFNYGLSGSTARETVFHLKTILARPGKGVVLVNLDPWGLGNGKFLGDYRFVAELPQVKAEPKINVAISDRIPGIRFQGKTRSNLAEYVNNRLAVTKTMECGAILQKISRSEDEWAYIISKYTGMDFSCDTETRDMLSRVLAENDRHEIVFVVSPIAEPWQERFKGAEKLAAFEEWLRGFPHVHVIGYSETSKGYGMEEFMDLTHLNESGARRFSRALRERLASLGVL